MIELTHYMLWTCPGSVHSHMSW